MKISIITPSVRPEGLALVKKALKNQSFTDFEHIVALQEHKPKKNEYWTIYSDYNRAIKQAKGGLIVSWQDYTWAKPDTLEKFWYHYTQEPKTLVTGVGDKYTDDTWVVKVWADPRKRTDYGTYYQCYHNDIEWNLCSVPKEALYKVGGFDERLNKYSSICGLDVLDRLQVIGGYDYKIDQTIESFSLDHGRLPDWEKFNPIPNGIYQKHREGYVDNPTLSYLS